MGYLLLAVGCLLIGLVILFCMTIFKEYGLISVYRTMRRMGFFIVSIFLVMS